MKRTLLTCPAVAPALALVILGLAPVRAQQPAPATAPAAPTYDSFCGKSRMEKQEVFRTISAADKTALWRTQIERWRALNQTRLTAAQRGLLDEMHATIPLSFVRPRTAENDAKLEMLEGRLTAAFSRDEMRALDNYGPCLAKAK
jgi:hypothetical protein